jgi:hypothetical protein
VIGFALSGSLSSSSSSSSYTLMPLSILRVP